MEYLGMVCPQSRIDNAQRERRGRDRDWHKKTTFIIKMDITMNIVIKLVI